MVAYWAIALAQNRRADANAPVEEELVDGFMDLTDKQQEGFKYTT